MIDLSILCQFFELNISCQECKQHAISNSLAVEKKSGFSHILQLNCEACEFQSTLETSKKVDGTGSGRASNEVNLQMVIFARSIGRGYSVLENFSACLNSPQPMTKKNYKKAFSKVLAANKEAAKESMEAAAIEIKTYGVSKCAVSLDGSWQRRGHSSHHGIVGCISIDTGKCIDIEVLSNFCEGCSYWEGKPKDTRKYIEWQEKHKCKKDHDGSAGAMEPTGAASTFLRSESNHGLQFQKYLGDGDSASFKKISQLKPYGEECDIEKIECVGHVQKRCGGQSRRFKKEYKGVKLSDGKGISGVGRLTDKTIDTLQNYYGFAIRQNVGNLEAMQKSVSAILPHVASNAGNKMHYYCPDGPDS